MKFKEPGLFNEYSELPIVLQNLAQDFDLLSGFFGVEAVVTRVKEPIQGSSGVHEAGRAIDFRDEYQGNFIYNSYQRVTLIKLLNDKYYRSDNHKSVISHRFQGGNLHFHLQVPADQTILKLWGGIKNG